MNNNILETRKKQEKVQLSPILSTSTQEGKINIVRQKITKDHLANHIVRQKINIPWNEKEILTR